MKQPTCKWNHLNNQKKNKKKQQQQQQQQKNRKEHKWNLEENVLDFLSDIVWTLRVSNSKALLFLLISIQLARGDWTAPGQLSKLMGKESEPCYWLSMTHWLIRQTAILKITGIPET